MNFRDLPGMTVESVERGARVLASILRAEGSAPTNYQLALETAYPMADWANARARLGPFFHELYQQVASLAATSDITVSEAADTIGNAADVAAPEGWRP